MKKSTKQSLGILALVVVAVVAGLLGGKLSAGGTAGAASQGSWAEEVKNRGELRVGVAAFAPMLEERNGTWTGPVLLPLEAFAKNLGVKFTPVPASWNTIVAGLKANKYDMAAGLDITGERSLTIMYTDPYYEDNGVWVVRRDSGLTSTADIMKTGQPVASSQGSAHEAAAKAAGFATLSVDSWTNAIQAVKAGRAPGQFTDYGTALGQVRSDSGLAIVVPETPMWMAPVSYGVSEEIDVHSLQMLNVAIRESIASGERDRAFEKVGYISVANLGPLKMGA
ncbi:substrate-binding periplasmic protein [Mycobacterium dioxanotrophicus]|nr:transporter substrate-binding domain-containing protein [Mycobacterium dioxanotrophicus]